MLIILRCGKIKKFGDVKRKVQKWRVKLGSLQNAPPTDVTFQKKAQVENELDRLLEVEQIYWKQRSKVSWLKYGDCNTKGNGQRNKMCFFSISKLILRQRATK